MSVQTLAPKHSPIDIEAAAASLRAQTGIADTLFPNDYGLIPSREDERLGYLPFVDTLVADPRKSEIELGLGRLGLLVVTPNDMNALPKPQKQNYMSAVLWYASSLDTRSRLLRTEGQIEGLQRCYPNTDYPWASSYANELSALREIVVASKVYEIAKSSRRLSRESSRYRVEQMKTGKIVVCRAP
jgi:hypothetical protein